MATKYFSEEKFDGIDAGLKTFSRNPLKAFHRRPGFKA
jgi:hypothetical protein